MATIEERVKRGAAWLDTIKPYWYDEVTMGGRPLDGRAMETCSDCVGGRVFDSYGSIPLPGTEGNELDHVSDPMARHFDEVAADYGFTIDWSQFRPDEDYYEKRDRVSAEFVQLARCWNTEIELRVQKEAADDDPRRA